MDVSVNVGTCDLGLFSVDPFFGLLLGFPPPPLLCFMSPVGLGSRFGSSSIIPLFIRIDCCFVFVEILNISGRSIVIVNSSSSSEPYLNAAPAYL